MPRHEKTPEAVTRTCDLDGCFNSWIFRDPRKRFCCKKHADAARSKRPATTNLGYTSGEPSDDELIAKLQERGFYITKDKPTDLERTRVIEASTFKEDGHARFGVVSDTHLGSKWQQITALRKFYEYAEHERKVDFFLHGGDVVDGSPKHHRDTVYNMFAHGFKEVRDYAVANYPVSRKKTYVIAGNHDYSFLNDNGADIVEDICRSRKDLEYLGPIGAYLQIGTVRLYLMHPFDAGAKTLSTKPQNWINQVAPHAKPHILMMGNYHKALHLPAYRNVEGFLLPSFQDQTPFMRSKSLESVIGGIIVDLWWNKHGIARLATEWVLNKVPLENDYPSAKVKGSSTDPLVVPVRSQRRTSKTG